MVIRVRLCVSVADLIERIPYPIFKYQISNFNFQVSIKKAPHPQRFDAGGKALFNQKIIKISGDDSRRL